MASDGPPGNRRHGRLLEADDVTGRIETGGNRYFPVDAVLVECVVIVGDTPGQHYETALVAVAAGAGVIFTDQAVGRSRSFRRINHTIRSHDRYAGRSRGIDVACNISYGNSQVARTGTPGREASGAICNVDGVRRHLDTEHAGAHRHEPVIAQPAVAELVGEGDPNREFGSLADRFGNAYEDLRVRVSMYRDYGVRFPYQGGIVIRFDADSKVFNRNRIPEDDVAGADYPVRTVQGDRTVSVVGGSRALVFDQVDTAAAADGHGGSSVIRRGVSVVDRKGLQVYPDLLARHDLLVETGQSLRPVIRLDDLDDKLGGLGNLVILVVPEGIGHGLEPVSGQIAGCDLEDVLVVVLEPRDRKLLGGRGVGQLTADELIGPRLVHLVRVGVGPGCDPLVLDRYGVGRLAEAKDHLRRSRLDGVETGLLVPGTEREGADEVDVIDVDVDVLRGSAHRPRYRRRRCR